ncbi:MAG: aldose epimerase family protein [Clostridium sp.]|uniref:aldose epimerase family protein n=1 Tax=Clostridium sp. TaxID=1506 RepID=UPI003072DEEB
MKISVGEFNKGDRSFDIYTLVNDNNMVVEILSLGGVITKILTGDKDGNFENIVLSYENYEDYYENDSYLGAIVGRTAGRIGGGEIIIEGEKIVLTKNNNGNTLHGGETGLHDIKWKGEVVETEDTVGVKLRCLSAHGEGGYPGNVNLEVYYSLNNKNELSIGYFGTTDKNTLLNLTNHSYFNLSGNGKRDILNHVLIINSDKIAEMDEKSIVTGRLLDVKETPFNFNIRKEIGRDIDETKDIQIIRGSGYDHCWILNKNQDTGVYFKDEESGRAMEVITDTEAVVFYSMNFPTEKLLSGGTRAKPRMAGCFETQSVPIGYNGEFKEASILKPGEEYRRTTILKFS